MSHMEKAGVSRREMVLGMGGLAVMVTSFAAGEAEANFGQRPRYTIKNNSSRTIHMKLVGHTNNWLSQNGDDAVLSPQEQYEDNLFIGERALIVWDNKGKLLGCALVPIENNPGHIQIELKDLTKLNTIHPTSG